MTGLNGLVPKRRGGTTALWSTERVVHLTTLWSRGLSARQISRELGHGISRGSVLAKIRRLGISQLSPHGGRHPVRSARKRRPPAAKGLAAIVPRPVWLVRPRTPLAWVVNAVPYVDDPLLDADVPHAQRRSLLQLNCRTCRWPVGDPATAGFFFCGARPLDGEAYCAAHRTRAVRPAGQAAQHARGARLLRTMRELRDIDVDLDLDINKQ